LGATRLADSQAGATELEQSRRESWQRIIQTIALTRKVQTIQSFLPKMTFAQGMHELYLNKDHSRKLGASVVRCLLNETYYDASPAIVFSVLAPPSLDAEFALQLSAFNAHQTDVTIDPKVQKDEGFFMCCYQLVSNLPIFVFTRHRKRSGETLGGGFIQFDEYFSDGLKPPTRIRCKSIQHILWQCPYILTSTGPPHIPAPTRTVVESCLVGTVSFKHFFGGLPNSQIHQSCVKL